MDSCQSSLVAGPSFGETLEGTRGLAEHGGRRDGAERAPGRRQQTASEGSRRGRRRLSRSGRYLGDLAPKIKAFMGIREVEESQALPGSGVGVRKKG